MLSSAYMYILSSRKEISLRVGGNPIPSHAKQDVLYHAKEKHIEILSQQSQDCIGWKAKTTVYM